MYLFNHRKKRKKIKDFLMKKINNSGSFFFETLKQDIPTPCIPTNSDYNFSRRHNCVDNILVRSILIKFSGIMKNYNREFICNHVRRYGRTKLQVNYRYISQYYSLKKCIFTSIKNNKIYIKTFINIFNNNDLI